MKTKKRIRSLKAITIRLAALLLALWLVCMGCITMATTCYVLDELTEKGFDFAEYAYMAGGFDMFSSDDEWGQEHLSLPGAMEYCMNDAMATSGISISPPSFSEYPGDSGMPSIFSDEYIECQSAMLFLDAEGNIIRENGDYVYFPYITAESWQSRPDSPDADGYGWIDLNDENDERYDFFRVTYSGVLSLYDYRALRITGYFDGSRIEPLAMAIMTDSMYYNALEELAPGWDIESDGSSEMTVSEDGSSATVSVTGDYIEPPYTETELDAMGLIEWDVKFDNTAQAKQDKELVTVYALQPRMFLYEPADPIRYQTTEKYENLLELLKTMGYYRDKGNNVFYSGASWFDLWNLTVFSSYGIYDLQSYDPTGGQPVQAPEYKLLAAMQANPVKIAMSFLRRVYIVTFALTLIGFLTLRGRIKKRLTAPLAAIAEGMSGSFPHIPEFVEKPPKWKEPFELSVSYRQTADKLRTDKNEIARLSTALDYAKTAEETRRQMTSNIAHELKTPLAVIHSYAEGLKEHIADDKRDKYLDVILSEAERMDGMVLEMLDLSRLEAGKVKLARDEFSLNALTRAIFEKLEPATEAKGLEIKFDFPEECTITADESRIAQVVENFATNAVKYTPVGGHISVRIAKTRGGTSFAIENDSAPLSGEALSKVWDTFYRADEARSGGGTGLGLAIAKSIVELHGGKCSVRNTKTGVEFMFPL